MTDENPLDSKDGMIALIGLILSQVGTVKIPLSLVADGGVGGRFSAGPSEDGKFLVVELVDKKKADE